MMGIPIDTLKFAFDAFRGVSGLNPDEQKEWAEVEKNAEKTLGKEGKEQLRAMTESAVDTMAAMLEGVSALSFDVDREIGTDRVVFAVQGPNMGNYGNAEVAVVFREGISRHPDFFMTPVAAMGYYQGWYVKNSNVGTDRPWAGEAKAWRNGGQRDYEESKFHGTTRRWAEACAMEWVARVVQNGYSGKGPAKSARDVRLEDVQELWHRSDPHTAIEAHLPGFVPLDYVERVYVAKSVRGEIGKAEEMLSRHGVCVEYVDDTRAAVESYMNAPQRLDASVKGLKGYSFYVEDGGKECTVPIDLERVFSSSGGCEGKVVRFTVVSCGSSTTDLKVTLSNKVLCANKKPNSPQSGDLSFVLKPFNDNGFIVDYSKGTEEQIGGFSSSASGLVTYYSVSFEGGKIRFSKSGVSCAFNNVPMDAPMRKVRFISFSSVSYPCYVSYIITQLLLFFSFIFLLLLFLDK